MISFHTLVILSGRLSHLGDVRGGFLDLVHVRGWTSDLGDVKMVGFQPLVNFVMLKWWAFRPC